VSGWCSSSTLSLLGMTWVLYMVPSQGRTNPPRSHRGTFRDFLVDLLSHGMEPDVARGQDAEALRSQETLISSQPLRVIGWGLSMVASPSAATGSLMDCGMWLLLPLANFLSLPMWKTSSSSWLTCNNYQTSFGMYCSSPLYYIKRLMGGGG
jgi:hypothetical protein